MNWREFKKLAESNGWKFERHGKEHDIYSHPKIRSALQIERYWSQEVRKGILHRLLKQVKGE